MRQMNIQYSNPKFINLMESVWPNMCLGLHVTKDTF